MLHSNRNPQGRRRVAALVVAIGACLFTPTALAENFAQQVSGAVELGRGDPPQWRALSVGDALEADDRVRTGADGRVEISMEAGTVRVHENSLLRLPKTTGRADRVDLDRGHSLFDVLRRAGRRFEVHTPTVVVSVKGTRFGVDAQGPSGEVAVYRGMVGVRQAGSAGAIETLVREGFVATGGSGQPIELDLAPDGDPWASWQDFGREISQPNETPGPVDDVDQARAVLHRATNADVLERAAERKPEVAERLRQMKRAPARDALPAAPRGLPDEAEARKGGRGMDGAMMRRQLMEHARERQEMAVQDDYASKIEALREVGLPATADDWSDPSAGGSTAAQVVQSFTQEQIEFVMSARDAVWQDYATSALQGGFIQPTPDQFMLDLEQEFMDMGRTPEEASWLINEIQTNLGGGL